jgi:mannosyltransferase
MTTHEAPGPGLVAAPPSPRTLVGRDRLIVASLALLALALRVPNIGRSYWVDEGITIGISSHPLRQLPKLLREDGSPPLFYVLLHFWMRLFGTSTVATHALPLVISLVAIPLAFWAGKDLFDRRAGLAAAALVATNPFFSWYSTETRMYTLVVVLSMAGVTLAWRYVRDRRWIDGAGAVAAFAALLYTHDWGIYLTLVTALVLFGLAVVRNDRRLGLAVIAGLSAVVVLWLPWVPSFLAQAKNTAAPWANSPPIGDFFADPSSALGGTLGVVVVPLLAAGCLWTRGRRRPEDGHLAGLLGAIGLLTTLAGFLGAQIEPSWTVRYLAVIVAPFLLAAAGALAPSRRGMAIVAAVCVLLAGWSVTGSVLPNPNAEYAKSNVAAVARAAAPELRPGDVVVVTQTEQVPVLKYYLPPGLLYVTPTGPDRDPGVVDWRDIVRRLQQAEPCSAVAPTIDSLPIGAAVLEVNPARELGETGTTWNQAVTAQVVAVNHLIDLDPALLPVVSYTNGLKPTPFSPVDAVLFEKTSTAGACA